MASRNAFSTSDNEIPVSSMTRTDNGALSHKSTGKALLDAFSRIMARKKESATPDAEICRLLTLAYEDDPSNTLRFIAYLRDVRGGKGERHAGIAAWKWLATNHMDVALKTLCHVPYYGRWKDLFDIAEGTPLQVTVCKMFRDQLLLDVAVYQGGLREFREALEEQEFRIVCAETLGPTLQTVQIQSMAISWDWLEDEDQELLVMFRNRVLRTHKQNKAKAVKAAKEAAIAAEATGEPLPQPRPQPHAEAGPAYTHPLDSHNLSTISLAAKWAPTEGSSTDKKAAKGKYPRLSFQLATMLKETYEGPQHELKAMALYRKVFISPLRQELDVVERHLCGKTAEDILLSAVPGVAMTMYSKKAFPKHIAEQFAEYQRDLTAGTVKVNSGTVEPFDLVTTLSRKPNDPVAEAMYRTHLDKLRAVPLDAALVICDTSASMTWNGGNPMTACLAIGSYVSALTPEPWHDMVLTFTSEPTFVNLVGCDTLTARMAALRGAPAGMSTDLQAVFDLILSRAAEFRLTNEQMPKRLVIVSDMQFNVAGGSSYFTNLETIRAKYRASGYDLPVIVFWNVDGAVCDSPGTMDDKGVILVGGYSKSILKSIVEGGDWPTPVEAMMETLANPRYDRMAELL